MYTVCVLHTAGFARTYAHTGAHIVFILSKSLIILLSFCNAYINDDTIVIAAHIGPHDRKYYVYKPK